MSTPMTIDAADFISFAERIAERAYGAVSVAFDDLGLWCYADGSFEITEKPSREEVTFAPILDYATREDLRNRLVVNARACAVCSATLAEHCDFFRARGTGACDEYDGALHRAEVAA